MRGSRALEATETDTCPIVQAPAVLPEASKPLGHVAIPALSFAWPSASLLHRQSTKSSGPVHRRRLLCFYRLFAFSCCFDDIIMVQSDSRRFLTLNCLNRQGAVCKYDSAVSILRWGEIRSYSLMPKPRTSRQVVNQSPSPGT